MSASAVPFGWLAMTIEREAATTEDTLYRVLGNIKIARAAEVTGRKPDYLRVLSHPDRRECLTFDDAMSLDQEHIAFDGTAPFFELFGARLQLALGEVYVDATALHRAALEVLEEDGHAHVALVAASVAQASDAALAASIRESLESAAAHNRAACIAQRILDKRRNPQPP